MVETEDALSGVQADVLVLGREGEEEEEEEEDGVGCVVHRHNRRHIA